MARLGISNRKKENVFTTLLRTMREPLSYCCEGCERIDPNDKTLCNVYIDPEKSWRLGHCALATHVKIETEKKGRVRVGQQKQRHNR
ncbi:MAG: PxxKW family cysteine-rich protein [Candidatus Thorarchaeota archaeon]